MVSVDLVTYQLSVNSHTFVLNFIPFYPGIEAEYYVMLCLRPSISASCIEYKIVLFHTLRYLSFIVMAKHLFPNCVCNYKITKWVVFPTRESFEAQESAHENTPVTKVLWTLVGLMTLLHMRVKYYVVSLTQKQLNVFE